MKTEVLEHFEDEMEDVCEYLDLAERAEETAPTLAAGMRAMAHDEYTHAEFLHDYLESVGVHEYADKWNRVKERMRK